MYKGRCQFFKEERVMEKHKGLNISCPTGVTVSVVFMALILGILSMPRTADGEPTLMNYGYSRAWLSLDADSYSQENSGEGTQSSAQSRYPTIVNPDPDNGNVDSGEAEVAVNPDDRTMEAYVYIKGDGGSGFLGNEISISGLTTGYIANRYKIEAGTSGLSEGDDVELVFSTEFDGTKSIDVEASSYSAESTSGSQVFDVTGNSGIDGAFLEGRVNMWDGWELEGTLGDPGWELDSSFDKNQEELLLFYSSLDPVPVGGPDPFTYDPVTGEVSYDSGVKIVDAQVGDSIFVENYFSLLASARCLNTSNEIELDFLNTMTSPVSFAQGYEDLQLSPEALYGTDLEPAVIPAPPAMLLAASGLFSLYFSRFLKRRTTKS